MNQRILRIITGKSAYLWYLFSFFLTVLREYIQEDKKSKKKAKNEEKIPIEERRTIVKITAELKIAISGFPEYDKMAEEMLDTAGLDDKLKKIKIILTPEQALEIRNQVSQLQYAREVWIDARLSSYGGNA